VFRRDRGEDMGECESTIHGIDIECSAEESRESFGRREEVHESRTTDLAEQVNRVSKAEMRKEKKCKTHAAES